MSISSALPELVEAVLEGANRICVDYILGKTCSSRVGLRASTQSDAFGVNGT